MPPSTEAAILERLLEPDAIESARYVLQLRFPPADRARMEQLAAEARTRTLTAAEQAEQEAYRRVGLLLARMQETARRTLAAQAATPEPPVPEIPPGIRRSQEALRRDLPKLLENKRLMHQWVAYHGEERIGTARNATTLIREVNRRGLKDDEYYIGWIDPSELIEEEELDPPPPDLEDEEDDGPPAR
jgi:hypothetical protein